LSPAVATRDMFSNHNTFFKAFCKTFAKRHQIKNNLTFILV